MMNAISLQDVKDEDVPGMLFLSVSPTRMEETVDKEEASKEVLSEGESDSTHRLLKTFESALLEKTIYPLRRELQVRLLKLSAMEIQDCDNLSTVERNFTEEDQLSIDEEDALRFTEILERFNYPVPKAIKERFDAIVKNKKISLKESEGSKKKTFFVYAEIMVLKKVCNSLSQHEVHEMYRIVKEMKGFKKDDTVKLPDVPLEALYEVSGLKDIAFYYLVLSLMRKKMMNGLYTHKLIFLLHQLQQMHAKNNQQDHIHIDRALATLSRYPIASHPPGLCLIFVMKEGRDGAEEDRKRVKDLFENEFMYDVVEKVDPKAEEIESIISKLKPARNKFYDSLVVWFMGHGSESYLEVKDKRIHRRHGLIVPFTKIKWFHKKPKIFFIQACALEESRKNSFPRERFPSSIHSLKPAFFYIVLPLVTLLWGVTSLSSVLPLVPSPLLVGLTYLMGAGVSLFALSFSSTALRMPLKALLVETDSKSWITEAGPEWQKIYAGHTDVSKINSLADTLVSYATMWYQPAARGAKGSLYVDTLVDRLKEYGRKESIENVLRRVHYNVNTVMLQSHERGKGEVEWKQAPYFESSLQKEFIFPENPKPIDRQIPEKMAR